MSKREAIVYGRRACLMVAQQRAQDIKRVFYEDGAPNRDLKPLLQSCAQQRRPYRAVSAEELFKISGSTHHEGVVVVTKPLASADFETYLLGRYRARFQSVEYEAHESPVDQRLRRQIDGACGYSLERRGVGLEPC